jgi:hypothetical protein
VGQWNTGSFKKKYTLSKMYFTKTTDDKSMSCVRMERKSLKFWCRWSEAAHHWGCGCCYLWHAATSVGKAGLSILHKPRHTWGSHRVLVRCENNFESSPFSLYIERRHMFNRLVKLVFESVYFFLNSPVQCVIQLKDCLLF